MALRGRQGGQQETHIEFSHWQCSLCSSFNDLVIAYDLGKHSFLCV